MQPLLLLKQTLEATYDPGALLLNGPNVRFTSIDQFMSKIGARKRIFSVGVGVDPDRIVSSFFTRGTTGINVERTTYEYADEIGHHVGTLKPGMDRDQIRENIPWHEKLNPSGRFDLIIRRDRVFLRYT